MAHLVSRQALVLDKALGWLIFQAGLHVRGLVALYLLVILLLKINTYWYISGWVFIFLSCSRRDLTLLTKILKKRSRNYKNRKVRREKIRQLTWGKGEGDYVHFSIPSSFPLNAV